MTAARPRRAARLVLAAGLAGLALPAPAETLPDGGDAPGAPVETLLPAPAELPPADNGTPAASVENPLPAPVELPPAGGEMPAAPAEIPPPAAAAGPEAELARIRAELEALEARQRELRATLAALAARLGMAGTPAAAAVVAGAEAEASEFPDEAGAAAAAGPGIAGAGPEVAEAEGLGIVVTGPGATAAADPDSGGLAAAAYRDPAQELFEQARAAFDAADFYGAAGLFEEFLQRHPEHALAAYARYWLGEARYMQGRYRDAIGEFEALLQEPAGPWHPVARLKVGYAWFELGDYARAREVLTALRDEEPGGNLARLAQLRLERLERLAPESSAEP